MALNAFLLELICKAAEQLPRPCRMLSLGYPDMFVDDAQLARILGPAAANVQYREDTASILQWHQLQGKIARLPETRSVFQSIGIETSFVDIVASRGFETVLDLNQPAPPELLGRYDIVYDGGTMEHCFNVGQVMRNVLGFARKGGFIIHANPMNMYNHGFFNFNPTFYNDWYNQSGNAIASPFYAVYGGVFETRVMTIDGTARILSVPDGTVLVVAAMKTSDAEPAWPMQAKYLINPELKVD
jgi:hypothetical protein